MILRLGFIPILPEYYNPRSFSHPEITAPASCLNTGSEELSFAIDKSYNAFSAIRARASWAWPSDAV
jgi:hypothetical protein